MGDKLSIFNEIDYILAEIAPDGVLDGTSQSVPKDLTATDVLLGILSILGFIFVIYLMFKLGMFLVNRFVFNDDNDYDE